MIHLDTHVVVWLAAGELGRFPEPLIQRLESEDLAVSPIVQLELAFLREIGRISVGPERLLSELSRSTGLRMDPTPFEHVAALATSQRFAFTRDPFDRLIAAQAAAAEADLATKDEQLRQHLPFARWE